IRSVLQSAGVGVIGYGLAIGNTPFCTCTVGHDWAAPVFGSNSSLFIPNSPFLAGVQLGIQGADLGRLGGCASPAVELTDTFTFIITDV
ncbi:MAG: hypothetical protein KDC98_13765, partial [Planctomycetes bacterium]|nr:hypothetical protein [Planctomycetota bacterium]